MTPPIGGEAYQAYCTSTYRRVAYEHWCVVQHQPTLAPETASQHQGRSDEMERAQKDAGENRESNDGYR